MHQDIAEILFDENRLKNIAEDISNHINADYADKSLVVVGVLKGSFVFLADLFRRLNVDCTLDFIAASSYGSGTVSSGSVEIKKDISADVKDKHVILVEDILDTGNTLSFIREYIARRGAASVKICTLLDKPSRRKQPIIADYVGAEVEDVFIVGYGLDYNERYRNLPYIGVLKPEIYTH